MRLKPYLAFLAAVLLLSAAPVSSSPGKKQPVESSRKSTDSSAKNADKLGSRKTSTKRSKGRRRDRGPKAPTPDRIREIQSALAHEGAYSGEPNGKWGPASVEAMKRFQASHGLSPTGKLDALSLQKLGLGSGVAGLAAPRVPAPPLPAAILRPR
jgi:peptidoglycan hydrolase-like protein with peptidoglycan-binding domain